MFYVGRIYAIYERIFEEEKRSINQFEQIIKAPDKLLPKLESMARTYSSYKKYQSQIVELYSKLNSLPEQYRTQTKLDFVMGYMTQKDTFKN